MGKYISSRAATYARNRRQAYVLFLLGLLSLLSAWLIHPDTGLYPIGVLVLGGAILLSTFLNPYRLVAAGWIVAPVGLAVFLFFRHLIPDSQVFPVYILAIGVGLLAIATMSRRGYVGRGAITPALLVLAIAIIEILLVGGNTPAWFLPFMLSLWLPGSILLGLGVIYLFTSGLS